MKKLYLVFAITSTFFMFNCAAGKSAQGHDGLSYDTAIKVNSVDKEYALLPSLCPGCDLKTQSLSSKGDKHYDVMTMVKPSGEVVSFYFDITSFFGKY